MSLNIPFHRDVGLSTVVLPPGKENKSKKILNIKKILIGGILAGITGLGVNYKDDIDISPIDLPGMEHIDMRIR